MRLNQYLAKHTVLSRRSADEAIKTGRVLVNGERAEIGQAITESDAVTLNGNSVMLRSTTTIMLNKPVKIICSKQQQGNVPTVYSLLPQALQHLSYIGRLDKDTSGLLIMSNDGKLIQRVTHPSHKVDKQYQVQLDKILEPQDLAHLQQGVMLKDGLSKFRMHGKGRDWVVTIHEGRNRQIRRTFEALGYEVTKLHRSKVGSLELGDLEVGKYTEINTEEVL